MHSCTHTHKQIQVLALAEYVAAKSKGASIGSDMLSNSYNRFISDNAQAVESKRVTEQVCKLHTHTHKYTQTHTDTNTQTPLDTYHNTNRFNNTVRRFLPHDLMTLVTEN